MSFRHQYDPKILREYDIRGLVGKNLNESDLYATGRAFGSYVVRKGGKKIGLCYDGRESSPRFAAELIRGLIECGLQIENLGLGPTPMVYFALHDRDLDAAVAITGSHNPPEYNGIKMALRTTPVFGEAIQELGRMAASGDFETHAGGQVQEIDIYDSYTDRLAQSYTGGSDLKIAWDAGNGAAGIVLKRLTDKIPGTHILLFDDVDGNFPNHHPDPAVEKNLEDLKRAVIEHKCDIGIAFDGDADRIGAVDKNGVVLWADQMVALYAMELLERKPGSTVIIDIKCSQSAFDFVKQRGGNPIIWKSGHSTVKAKMMETKAEMGGELSGHIFFKDQFYGHDDALYCAVRLLNIVEQYGPLDTLQKLFPPVFNTPEIRFDVPEEDKFAIIARAHDIVLANKTADTHVLDIDGIRVSTPQGWWLLRASNTQNALTARVEATSVENLQLLENVLKQTLKAAGCDFPEKLY